MGKIKLTLLQAVILAVVSLFLAVSSFFYVSFIQGSFKEMWQKTESSSADLRLERESLNIKLNVSEKEKDSWHQFSQKLGVDENLAQGVSLELNEETASSLARVLPAIKDPLGMRVKVEIFPEKVEFGPLSSSGIFNPTYQQTLKTASFGGMLRLDKLAVGGYELEVEEPEQVVVEAVVEKKMNIAPQLLDQGFFKLLSKVARIKVKVQNQALNGTIVLK